MPASVVIVLCTYNGADWLCAQLDSIAAQDHKDWTLWISDDGSTDTTGAVIAAFQARHSDHDIRLLTGPGQGAAQNFLSLITHADLPLGPQTCLALCDQDDIWFPEKLGRGLSLLANQPDSARPLIYGAQSCHIDRQGREIGKSRRPKRDVCLQNAVVQNMISGHSLLLNPAALALARAAGRPLGVGFQDWWLQLLVLACGGRAIVDQAEVLLYRQHGANVMGAPKGIAAARRRLQQLKTLDFRGWITANLAGLASVEPLLTSQARDIRQGLGLGQNRFARLQAYRKLGIRRQSTIGTALLYGAVLCGLA